MHPQKVTLLLSTAALDLIHLHNLTIVARVARHLMARNRCAQNHEWSMGRSFGLEGAGFRLGSALPSFSGYSRVVSLYPHETER